MTVTHFNPVDTAARLGERYRRYLGSMLRLSEPSLDDALQRALQHAPGLERGPFLQVAPPFASGRTLHDLVEDGLLPSEMLALERVGFSRQRPLYFHQEQAITKAVGGRRNLLVATGTGSGKTETFLLPILAHLVKERTRGTLGPGVRALLLYPMNVLANDQMRRFRELLAPYPDLTFGRYIGATEDKASRARTTYREQFGGDPLPNELLSREEMHATPPHILITNYSMLEYLLLRTPSLRLFNREDRTWRFIVLDEVHTYAGAKGAEIAALLRRVKERVLAPEEQSGRLQCIGTSATLGDRRACKDLAIFGEALYGEPFEWDEADEARQDVVLPTRVSWTDTGDVSIDLPEMAYGDLLRAYGEGESALRTALMVLNPSGAWSGSSEAMLATLLLQDRRMLGMRRRLVDDAVIEPSIIAREFFPLTGPRGLVPLVTLGTVARPAPDAPAILPARFHYFLRALDGAFFCLQPTHREDSTRAVLQATTHCTDCGTPGALGRRFEVAACDQCGAPYVVGTPSADARGRTVVKLVASGNKDAAWYHLLPEGHSTTHLDDDEEADEASGAVDPFDLIGKTDPWLCTGCGVVHQTRVASCECGMGSLRAVRAAKVAEEGVVTQCVACQRKRSSGIVRRVGTNPNGPLSVVATELYQSLPQAPPIKKPRYEAVGGGRKLITFSDSRQQAAQFATFMDRTYTDVTRRSLLLRVLREEDEWTFRELSSALAKRAQTTGMIIRDQDMQVSEDTWAMQVLLSEAVSSEQRISLAGVGLLDVSFAIRGAAFAPAELTALGFTGAEQEALVQQLLRTLLTQAVLTVPAKVSTEALDIPGRVGRMRLEGHSAQVASWLPSTGRVNRRLQFLRRVFGAQLSEKDLREYLRALWHWLIEPSVGLLTPESDPKGGLTYGLAVDRLHFQSPQSEQYGRCDRCQALVRNPVRRVCPTFNCQGTVQWLSGSLVKAHYRSLYEEAAPIPAVVEEHTAQVEAETASSIQERFQQGAVNILSCSTTFELGVDVGEVEAVLMRNVPPSPANYVQRAGRAGRRASGNALVVTYAQRRNHDLYYFDRPEPLVRSVVMPPVTSTANLSILRRHVHAIAFAMWQRESGREDRKVEQFFGNSEVDTANSGCALFRVWLQRHSPELVASISVFLDGLRVPADNPLRAGNGWVQRLLHDDAAQPDQAWLTRAEEEYLGEDARLRDQIKEATAVENYGRARVLAERRRTLRERELLGYLGRHGVLPKYGFPSDVVRLHLQAADKGLKGSAQDSAMSKVVLERDLQLAIAEYAPGGEVVAGKQVWRSIGVMRPPNHGLPTAGWTVCKECHAYAEHDDESIPVACGVCGAPLAKSQSGRAIHPLFGFVGEYSKSPKGAPPKTSGSLEYFFHAYKGTPPQPKNVVLADTGVALEVVSSPNGRIALLNRGPGRRGFQYCQECGHAVPAIRAKKSSKGHPRPWQGAKAPCRGTLLNVALSHQYLTDVLEIRPAVAMDPNQALGALHALVAGAATLGLPDTDIGGVLNPTAANRMGFVLYDTVPGGAGHVTSLGSRMDALFAAAIERVERCDCSLDTSCYGCLRTYRNERSHDSLTRRYALEGLALASGLHSIMISD